MDQRPVLNTTISVQDFQDFYWLKKELIAFCKTEGLKRTGSKVEMATRIRYYLKTGKEFIAPQKKTVQPKSKFDWNSAPLNLHTVITDNYKNTENVRQFFEVKLGKRFRFNVRFMKWMKSNTGQTLDDAIKVWHHINEEKKSQATPKVIAPQFEYNTYLRDFLANNPNKDRAIGIALWKIKKSRRGDNLYRPADLEWLEK